MKKTGLLLIVLLTTLSVFGQNNGQNVQDMFKAMTSGKKTELKPEYIFAGSATFEMTSNYKGKPYKGLQKWLIPNENDMTFGTEYTMEDNKGRKNMTRGIIDYKNKSMIMLMDENKMAMSIPFDIQKTIESTVNDPNLKNTPPKKTGKTKTILGYVCDEWVTESEEYQSNVWISREMPIKASNFYELMQQQTYKNNKILMPSGMSGMPLEIDGLNKKSKETYQMICVDINKSKVVISTAGYKTF